MTDTIHTGSMEDSRLTAKEIFDQLTVLQKQIAENPQNTLLGLDSIIGAILESGDSDDGERIADVCAVFRMREQNFTKLLALYEKMYDDVRGQMI